MEFCLCLNAIASPLKVATGRREITMDSITPLPLDLDWASSSARSFFVKIALPCSSTCIQPFSA